MKRQTGRVTPFRAKVSEVDPQPFTPSQQAINNFVLPDGIRLTELKKIASTVDLTALGVAIPESIAQHRRGLFEQGFRHGLTTNRLTDINLHFKRSFSHGFCWAKYFYRKFNPTHPLAAMGGFKGKG